MTNCNMAKPQDKIQKGNDPKLKRQNPLAKVLVNNEPNDDFQFFYSTRKGSVIVDNFRTCSDSFSFR